MTIQRLATRYGTMFVPDTDTAQYPWLVATGRSWEDAYIQEVCRLLRERPGGVAIDGGACYGEWTLALAPHCTSAIAVEPQTALADLVQKSVDENRLGNTFVENCSLGEADHVLLFKTQSLDRPGNFGGHEAISWDAIKQTKAQGTDRLDEFFDPSPVAAIDCLVRENDAVSFIKLDVEGCELMALRGAARTIERCRPIMFIETDHPRTDKRALLDEIESLGYAWDRRGPNVLAMPLPR